MELEKSLSTAENLAEKELVFLQKEKYDHAFKLAEKRKEIFSRLENADLSLVTGIKEKLCRLQAIQGILSKEARRLHNVLRDELTTIEQKKQSPSYLNTAVVTPLPKTLSTRA